RVDLREDVPRVLLQRVVQLPVERQRGAVHQMGGQGHLVAALRLLVVDVLHGVLHALALLEQGAAEPVHVGVHRVALRRSRASASAAVIPSAATSFSRPVWPATTLRFRRGSDSVSASKRSAASFARPRSGAEATRIRHASPWRPISSVLSAPGVTFTRMRAPSFTRTGYLCASGGPGLGCVSARRALRALVDRPERRADTCLDAVRLAHEPLALGAGFPNDAPGLVLRLADDQLGLFPRLLAELVRGALRGDERRPQQALELAEADDLGLE